MQQLADQMLLLLRSLLDWLLFYNTHCEKEGTWKVDVCTFFLTASKHVSYNKTRLKSFFWLKTAIRDLGKNNNNNYDQK